MYFDDSCSTSPKRKDQQPRKEMRPEYDMNLQTGELEITSFKQIFIQRPSKKKKKDKKKTWRR